jgi:hypothetical protein
MRKFGDQLSLFPRIIVRRIWESSRYHLSTSMVFPQAYFGKKIRSERKSSKHFRKLESPSLN